MTAGHGRQLPGHQSFFEQIGFSKHIYIVFIEFFVIIFYVNLTLTNDLSKSLYLGSMMKESAIQSEGHGFNGWWSFCMEI